MPYSTSFDGAADTVVGTADGWTLIGFTGNNFARLNGTGALKTVGSGGLSSTRHQRNEATTDHYAEVVLGANFAFMERLCFVRSNSSGAGFELSYFAGGNQLRLSESFNTLTLIPSSACVAGDTVRIETSGADQIRVYINGVLKHTRTDSLRSGQLGVGAKMNTGTTGYDDIIRSFASGSLTPADTTPPSITSLSLTATSASTLTGGFTSDEAGSATAVLYLAAESAPSDAQVLAGTNVFDEPAVSYILNQAMTVGSNSLLFTGADPETEYKFKVVARDAVPNVATGVVFAGTATTPAPPKFATVTLFEEDGTTPAASITGLQWAWWDAATPDFGLAASLSGTGASTSAGGVFSVSLAGSTLTLGQTGTLLIYKTDGIAESLPTLSFCGALEVVS